MKYWNSFKIAWSMYSRIQIPGADWEDTNMKYVMCFFPTIGILTGAVLTGLFYLFSFMEAKAGIVFPVVFRAVVLSLVPYFITGGIHHDGFMDTSDALSSFRDREEKLRIMKDSATGAFAVLRMIVCFLLYTAAFSAVDGKSVLIISAGFVLSRALSGLAIVSFPKASGTGLAALFSEKAEAKTVRVWMFVYIAAAAVFMVLIDLPCAAVVLIAAFLVFYHYYRISKKEFGGITGDLAGWFLIRCELAAALCAVVFRLVSAGIFK